MLLFLTWTSFIDESQDLGKPECKMFELLTGPDKDGPGVTTVGDPDQELYGFRDEPISNSSKPFQALCEKLGLRMTFIETTHRCTMPNIYFAQAILKKGELARRSIGLKDIHESGIFVEGSNPEKWRYNPYACMTFPISSSLP